MKKAVAYLVPFIEKEKEAQEQEMRAEGTWDENVSLYL
jgi:cobalamin-dependent methionine synthase I